jgi:citrate lyase subunit beta/citryl-CoA lyase
MIPSVNDARLRPRRTMLYVSADIERHVEKGPALAADSLIFDLHEAVSPEHKERARDKVAAALRRGGFRGQELVLRLNRTDSPWFAGDLALAAAAPLDAVLLTGLESGDDVLAAERALDAAGAGRLPIMLMIESPRAVLGAAAMAAASPRVACLVVSNANLMVSMRLPETADRIGLFASLSLVVLAARAAGIACVDGAHLDVTEAQACEYACRQSRDFGFDGKAVIHPVQLAYTNDAFTPKPKDVERKRAIVAAMDRAREQGLPYALMDGKLLQPSVYDAAKRCIAVAELIDARARQLESSAGV